MQYIRVRVPNFRPFRSTINRFQDVVHFRIFPLTPMLKFQSATKFFKTWPIAKKSDSPYSTMVANMSL